MVDEGELGAPELAALRVAILRRRKRAVVWALAPLLPVLVGVVSIALGLWFAIPGVCFFLLLPVATVAAVLGVHDNWRRVRLLRRELRDPRVATFELTLEPEDSKHARRALRLPYLPEVGTFRFTVCLASNRLNSVMGKESAAFLLVTLTRVARAAEFWGDRQQRPLSAEERDELRHRAKHAWSRPLKFGAFYIGLGAFAVSRGPALSKQSWHAALPAAIFGSLAVLFVVQILRGLRQARDFRTDVLEGVALRQALDEETPCEVLPASQTVWTISGEPAPWRTASRIARR
jgi:hypothetical protein